MSQKLTSADLDLFLKEKTTTPQAVATTLPSSTPPQTGIQQATSLVQTGNGGLNQITELVKGLNDLIKNGGDLFMKNLNRKEERINVGTPQPQQGGYKEYAKTRLQTKPAEAIRESPVEAVEMSHSQKANQIHEWFEATLDSIEDEEISITELKTQWRANKTKFVNIIKKILGGAELSQKQYNVNTANKEQKSKTTE